MLKEIHIFNYKCFKDNTITFKEKNNVIIGENNAGKSTLLEVIRIINHAVEKLKVKGYSTSSIEYGLGIGYNGIYIDLEDLNIETGNLFFQYEENTIKIIAKFNNNVDVNIYILEPSKVFAFANHDGINIKNNKKFKEIFVDSMAILPQISLLKKEEKVIQDDRTLRNINKRITSQHFRNEILLYKEKYPDIYNQYIEKITESWRGIIFNDIYTEGNVIYAIIREREFSIEVGKLGSGVQMWLQMLWFFIKNLDSIALVLDEPDIYLHSELQKRIIKIAKEYNKQLIITTHSIEIISEVNKDEIIILDKHKCKSEFVHELLEVQDILDKLGSSQIVNLVKLEKYNRIICVEGNDMEFLNIWHETLFPKSDISFKDIPSYKTGGWGSWDFEKSRTEKILKERDNYHIYYIYDKDYHNRETIEKRYKEAKRHVEENWDKYEYKISLIPGKEFIKKLIGKIKAEYNVQITMASIAREFKKEEIPDEMKRIITQIESQKDFYMG